MTAVAMLPFALRILSAWFAFVEVVDALCEGRPDGAPGWAGRPGGHPGSWAVPDVPIKPNFGVCMGLTTWS